MNIRRFLSLAIVIGAPAYVATNQVPDIVLPLVTPPARPAKASLPPARPLTPPRERPKSPESVFPAEAINHPSERPLTPEFPPPVSSSSFPFAVLTPHKRYVSLLEKLYDNKNGGGYTTR